jgi:hypothetical protein
MATKKNVNEVKQIKNTITRKGRRKPVVFGQKIDDLKKGEGLLITTEEWNGTGYDTPLPSYYYSKYNNATEKLISVTKTADGYLIEKLK